jgi:hypothetical protein
MMTLSENSRGSEQKFTMDRMGEGKTDARIEIREKQGVCIHQRGRNSTGFRFLHAFLQITPGRLKLKPATLFNF